MVRAKFVFTSYETCMGTVSRAPGAPYEQVELRTLKFRPVYGNGDPNHENTKFFAYTPCGEITLGTVNPEAWSKFELNKEYYLDFTPAP